MILIHIVMNASFASFESFIQFATTQKLASLENFVGKLFLEEQRKEAKLWE
jgi:hypothetical protein